MFFEKFFKKKSAPTPPPAPKPVKHEPVKTPRKETSLPGATKLHSYKEMEDVVRILIDDGFAVSSVKTYGEFSGHDFVDAFSREYSSIEEFQKNAYAEYAENLQRSEKVGPSLSWEGTFINLLNAETGLRSTISFSEHSPEDNERRSLGMAYLFFDLKDCIDDNETFDDLAAKLSNFTKKDTSTKKTEE